MTRMKKAKIKILILLGLFYFIPFIMKGQGDIKGDNLGDIMLTQHWAMPTLLNPAATGDIDFIRIRGGARLQYFGSHQSPKNFLATGDMPFKLMEKRIGAGVVVNSETYGLFNNLQIGAQGSYKIKIKNSRLSIGIQVGYYHSKFKGSELLINNTGNQQPDSGEEGKDENIEPDDTGDPFDLPTQDVDAGKFDMALGIRYDHPKFHIALSGQHVTNSSLKLTAEGETSTDARYVESKLPATLYFEAGGNIGINNSLITLQPSLLAATDFKDVKAVVDLRATYNQKVTFGVDYRWNRAVGVMGGLILKNFFIGYNWEYDYKGHPKGSTGNHEIVLGYQFKLDMGGKSNFSHRSIRIM